MKLTIQGELADLNTFIDSLKTNKYIGNNLKQIETNRVMFEAIQAKLPPVRNYPVMIVYSWYSRNRKKDIDNIAFAKKFINDGLVKARVLKNDSQKYISGIADNFFIDKQNPRIEVEIKEFN